MPCKKTLRSVFFISGDSLVLNCTCFTKSNGQWTGPKKRPSSASDHYIPYTHGTDLNPSLNKLKYIVFGGYDDNKCYLKITNFTSDDDGTYTCQYINSETIHIDVNNVVATNNPEPPENLSAVLNSTTFVVYWHPGFDGGISQRFYIEYRPESKPEWEVVGPIVQSNLSMDRELVYRLKYVLIAKKYDLGMYAKNIVGQSNNSNTFIVEMEGIVLEIPLEGQYYEIGSINDDNASTQGIPNHLQKSVVSVDRPTSQSTISNDYSVENVSSSEMLVPRLSNLPLNEDGYKNPYQTIDHANIELHPYSTITSNMYQNTTIFYKNIQNNNIEHTIQNDRKRDPWLIIYKQNSVNA
ncbi:unnamed protein product [Mytilus coruscus]|uniref:Immunoglobulin domain-containing protein n=1 Tax=Mytilus coruscus TaxID=42192 RepID=A0A6J8BKQ3_MYTCO|nr:unnamed protein product [Mytilus coruscus]